jgi:DNA repair exonuclease SbcCD nuclease subunit
MSLYLLLSDLHLSDKPPSSCTDSYTDDLFGLLEQTAKIARRRKVAAVCWAGDVFHIKTPSRTSHELVNRTKDLIDAYPCPVFIVPGNHDIRHDRLDSIDSQPLGALFRRHALRLEGWAGYDADTEYALYGVPWLQGYGDWAAYDGDDPHPPIELNLAEALRGYRQGYWTGTTRRRMLVVAHAPLYPPGQELQYEYFPAQRWAEAMGGGPGYVFYGHVHPWHGVYEAGGVTFCNHGALSRGSLHESELTREVGCTIWDDETGEFEFVPLDARPASEVFRLTEKQQVTDMQGRLDEFLASVGETTLEAVSVESVIAHIRTLGLGRDAEDLAAELITEAAHGG